MTRAPPPADLPRLYTFRRCPYAMRARLALHQAGRGFEAVEVSLRDKPASLLALSPKATVPVLHLPDGGVIEESWDIMRWALAEPDPQGWWARAQSPANLDLLRRNDGEFKRHLDGWKYPERGRNDPSESNDRSDPGDPGDPEDPGDPGDPGDRPTPEDHRDAALAVLLGPLETRLSRSRWLGGDLPCATDLAVLPFVRQYAAVARPWFGTQSLPFVQAWLRGWLDSPLFVTCMRKLPASATGE